ncbi:MAG TPA: branched-chain amino acid ABC transporter substrate-binding protein [Rhodopila sp.]|uniref:branched-chain amino acid ABC transporter substrate-binding protein n=1 Tax=Rhodopila sp. TaxID=2480087 RepID=UPI002C97B6B2|nr:branched-chain amino acid ABC transporter substrate-binding protein [Rhodopila sp.]HVY15042.1 branched-chain amino acid ABC transporter substrate-binding protein [Rhodopila sp.]
MHDQATKSGIRRRFLGTAAALALLLASGAARAQIHIAVAGPMTGEYAAFGQQMKEGADQAVADINKAGGVLGKQLVLDVGDDACDPKQAVSVANQLASKGVKLVAGHFCSGSSIPASKVYGEEGILQISPASTNPDYTDKGSWNTFRVCGRDDEQGKVAGDYLAKHFKGEKIAILNDNSAYGKGLADETAKALHAAGGKETLATAYTPGEKDYSSLVSRLKEAGINVIYVGGYHTEAGLIIRQAKEQGMKATLVGGDALVTNEFWQIAGDAGAGTMMTFPPDPRLMKSAADVVKEFKAKNIDPEGYVLYTYAAIQVWVDAAKKVKSTDPKKVATELKASGKWPSVLGPITFDKKGDVVGGGYVFYVWKNGAYAEM